MNHNEQSSSSSPTKSIWTLLPTPLAPLSLNSKTRSLPLPLSSLNPSCVSPPLPPLLSFADPLWRDQTDSFSRLIRESIEARDRTGDNLDYDDEKMLVQMNILKTIDQLTSSLDGTELITKVEAIIAPALEVTLRNNLVGESQCKFEGQGRC